MRRRTVALYSLKALSVGVYLAIVFEWIVAAVPYIAAAVKSDAYESIVMNHAEPSIDPVAAQALPSWALLILMGVLIVGVAVTVMISLLRAPKAIGEAGHRVTHTAADKILPVIVRHHIPAKKRTILLARFALYIKIALVILPVMFVLCVPPPQDSFGLTHTLLVAITGAVALWVLFLLGLQMIGARVFRISPDKLW